MRVWDPRWAESCLRVAWNPFYQLDPVWTDEFMATAAAIGATIEEIMEVLKLCVGQGVQACNLGVPILAEELARHSGGDRRTHE